MATEQASKPAGATSVRDIMSTQLITVEQDHSFNLAKGIMQMERIRHLPVVDGQRLVGLVTHRDIARAQASFLARPTGDDIEAELDVSVANIMQTHVRTVSPETRAVEAAKVLREHKIGCLPVIEENRLIGIVTETDFLSLLIDLLEPAG